MEKEVFVDDITQFKNLRICSTAEQKKVTPPKHLNSKICDVVRLRLKPDIEGDSNLKTVSQSLSLNYDSVPLRMSMSNRNMNILRVDVCTFKNKRICLPQRMGLTESFNVVESG